jgi:predicted deacetylase
MKKRMKVFLIILAAMVILLFFIKLISPREIDDLSPGIPCDQTYLQKADIVWVIPEYNNIPISDNQTWCKQILAMNKTIGMHGIYHSYHEFDYYVNDTQLKQAKQIFADCFGYEPTLFKPPYLRISKVNKQLLKENNLTLRRFLTQDTRKVFHCEDSGTLPNWFHNIY